MITVLQYTAKFYNFITHSKTSQYTAKRFNFVQFYNILEKLYNFTTLGKTLYIQYTTKLQL